MQVNIRGIPAPKLMNLTATAGVGSVSLTWDNPNNPIHKMTEVWTSAYSDGSNAQRLANVNDYAYVVVDASPTPMYYWVRSISIYGRVDGPISDMAIKAGNAVTGTAAQALSIGASSQIFLIQKGGAVAPQTISLFASTQNMQGTPVWSITAGTATLNDPSNANPYQKDLTYTSMTTDTVTVQVAMNGLTDQITLVKVKDGIDSLTSMLTNESANVPADATGAVTGGALANAGGSCIVYNGTNKVLTGATYSIIAPTSGLQMGITTAGVYSVTQLTADSGSAIVRAVYNGVVLDKVYNISKAKQGVKGTNGTNGGDGSNGQRGTVNIQVSGKSLWDSTAATNAIINATGTSPMRNDIVTEYDATHSFTYFWDTSVTPNKWSPVGAYINGNLVVDGTLSANKITTGYLSADRISGGTITGTQINIAGNFTVTGTTSVSTFISAPTIYNGYYSNGTTSALPGATISTSGSGPAAQCTSTGSGPAIKFNGAIMCTANPVGAASALNYFNNISPVSDNVYHCGLAATRWTDVYAVNNVIQSSDIRYKENVENSDLGLDFINTLRPVSYTLKERSKEITIEPEVEGPWPMGQGAPDADRTFVSIPGVRRHYGLIAQEVKAALGDTDAGIWTMADVDDPDSMQALRYTELISPLIKAVQELSAQVKSLQDQLNAAQ